MLCYSSVSGIILFCVLQKKNLKSEKEAMSLKIEFQVQVKHVFTFHSVTTATASLYLTVCFTPAAQVKKNIKS